MPLKARPQKSSLAIGTDILDVSRLKAIFSQRAERYLADPFVRRSYTQNEVRECEEASDPLTAYAVRFSGKEAVFKTLTVTGEDLRLDEIEILGAERGTIRVTLHGRAAQVAAARGVQKVHLSVSCERGTATAFCVAE